ncbi:hypothetical protein K2173_004025 [Erythroxylum novogranatense]|uniref:RecA family profile 1 domain-containing protein n=1 Tax=Erythroxylum novogranatense TaxID=1862640 RepID=A0AAV8SK54_9ROSI|nr:hypothetical protein K2173_004025 [Erythroxylum novogranatense]
MAVKGWIEVDESAKDMVSRLLLAHASFSLLPPSFHNLPLRLGNVVEIVGPSPSAKTHILIQAAINSILPKEWDGVHYGGLEQLVIFIDLDCRFDVLRLSQLLRIRILQANNNWSKSNATSSDQNLFALCMRRFLYTRCYDSLEFLATLKTLHYQLQKEKEAQGISGCILMIDSIGAFHWVDRASSSFQQGGRAFLYKICLQMLFRRSKSSFCCILFLLSLQKQPLWGIYMQQMTVQNITKGHFQ